ncbi:MAG TPA: PfkB family carbohydrate kinase, partial [Candidatus Limnocylindrales bacterium]|nr:PfkB family carbohydrate kinase [Candidatus Limnocylindrales bacterium]
PLVVVKRGAEGCEAAEGAKRWRAPSPKVEAIDTTGAGDAFVGAFAVGLGLGLDPATAVRLGIACASDSVTRPGTQASYPDRRRAEDLRAWAVAGGG